MSGMERIEAPVAFKTWLAVVGSAIGAFLAVLNIQIVNSSLADIQGAIGAGIDDGGWISTSYLVTEIIVIPLSGWLAHVFSVRRYLLVNTALFLVFSAACAFAHDLTQMLVYRAFQGFAGGVLIPVAFNLIITMLPKSKLPVGLAMFALSATFAPAIGPTIGGYLNENFGWQYVFFVNLAPGALMLAMLYVSLPRERMHLELLRQGDWIGIALMSIGLGALQTMLEEGNKDDWFGSPFIVELGLAAAIGLSLFLLREFTARAPLLDLRLLGRRNFGLGSAANVMLGAALYGSSFLLPLYLGQVQHYNAEQIGEVLAWTGLPQLLLIPLVPRLMQRIDARLLIAAGFMLFAASNFMNAFIDADVAADQLLWPNLVRALGQALVMTPLSAVTTAGLAGSHAATASSLFNMMRNLGGAIGIALLQTFLTMREQFHSNILIPSVSELAQAAQTRIDQLTAYFLAHGLSDRAAARHEAIIALGTVVRRQATVMAYGDNFFALGCGLILALMATILLKKAVAGGASAAH